MTPAADPRPDPDSVGHGLVIFDCDGVLVDSEPIANRILAQMLTELGVPTSRDEALATYLGLSMASCLEKIEGRLGRPVPDSFAADFRGRCRDAFHAELKPVAGMPAAIQALRWPVCVASSGDHEKIRTSLRLTGLLDRFEGRLYSAADVRRGKPWPDLFLFAAASMHTPPGRCVVVEDTVVGVRAGVAAGMSVLGLAGTTAAGALRAAGAALVFHDPAELPALVAQVLAPGHSNYREERCHR